AIMQKYINETIEKHKQNHKAKITVTLLGERPCEKDVDYKKLQQMSKDIVEICQKHTGLECHQKSGSTDANIPMSLGVPAVCVGSYKGGGAHTREEWIDITSLKAGSLITAETILRFFN
ncbi:MAG: peptidase, partial [Clostridia bacterium]|nr:peptidase [Clostridia bacterium]